MLRDAAVARVKQLLGFKQNLDSEIVQAMIETQEDLERSSELPFFLRKNYSELITEAGVKTLGVPSDFIREWDDDQLFMVHFNGFETPVVKEQEGFLRLRLANVAGPGTPQRYSRLNREFHFYPTPDAVYGVSGAYYGKDEPLSTNLENKWLKELPFILVARAGLMLAGGLRDKEGLAVFGQMNEIFTSKLHLMTTADDAAGARPIIGGDED